MLENEQTQQTQKYLESDLLSCCSDDLELEINHKSFSIESDISSIEDLESPKKTSLPSNKKSIPLQITPPINPIPLQNNNNNLNLDIDNQEIDIHIDLDQINEIKTNKKRRRTKEDLDKTPLPLFSCIYCSNEHIAFQHLSNTMLNEEYLYCYNKYNSDKYTKIIKNKRSLIISDNDNSNTIENLIIKHTEYLYKVYNKDFFNKFFSNIKFKNTCLRSEKNYKKLFIYRIENYISKKKNEIDLLNNKKTSNNNSHYQNKIITNSTNSLINNINHLSSYININLNYNIIDNKENNNSSINFNSMSLNNIDTNNTTLNQNQKNNNIINQLNSIGLDSIEENNDNSENERDQESFFNFFKFDLSKKISRDDIQWEEKCFDIWNPKFDD